MVFPFPPSIFFEGATITEAWGGGRIHTFNKAQAVVFYILMISLWRIRMLLLSMGPPKSQTQLWLLPVLPLHLITFPVQTPLQFSSHLPFLHWSFGPVSHCLAPRPLQELHGCYLVGSRPK